MPRMERMETKEMDGIKVKECTVGDSQKTCFCCGKKVTGCKAVILSGNYQKMPNILLHSECFSEWENKMDDLLGDIERAYEKWKQLDGVFGSALGRGMNIKSKFQDKSGIAYKSENYPFIR